MFTAITVNKMPVCDSSCQRHPPVRIQLENQTKAKVAIVLKSTEIALPS